MHGVSREVPADRAFDLESLLDKVSDEVVLANYEKADLDSLDGALPPSRTGARVQVHPAPNKLYASTRTQTPFGASVCFAVVFYNQVFLQIKTEQEFEGNFTEQVS